MAQHFHGLLAGSKFNGRHQTIIDGADQFIRVAKAIPEINKISIGIIKQCPVGQRRLKVDVMRGFISVKLRGVNAVQSFAIYGTQLESVAAKLSSIEIG